MNLRIAILLLAGTNLMATATANAQDTKSMVEPLRYTERTLPNGLRIYALRSLTTSNVAVQVWYRVGAKDDPRERSGFAHLFEHLMFKATRNMPSEQMDRLTEDVGGYNNAVTRDDYTAYYEYVPAAHLQALLFAEADRMSSLVVDAASLESERSVVRDELTRSTTARPYGNLLSKYLSASEYSVHPYARSAIGNLADLDAATLGEVRAFHRMYYRPDNAVLVVSGNFDPVSLNKWIDKYFGPLGSPASPVPRTTADEPARKAATVYTVRDRNTPLPAVFMSWHAPPNRHEDVSALMVLNTVLGSGDASRLSRALVQNAGLARSVESSLDTKEQTGNLVVRAFLGATSDVQQAQNAIAETVAGLARNLISTAELERAKAQLVTSALRERETAEGKAEALALGVMIDGDPGAADRRLSEIATVTADDVRKVALRYLQPEQSATIRQVPADGQPLPGIVDAIEPASTVHTTALAPIIGDGKPATPERMTSTIPSPGLPLPPVPPQVTDTRLGNGLRLVTAERPDSALSTITLIAKPPLGRQAKMPAAALALTVQSMLGGTTSRTATQIAQQVEGLGATILARTDVNGASIEMTVRSDHLEDAAALLADIVQRPVFPVKEVERIRGRLVDASGLVVRDPQRLAGFAAARVLMGDTPLGTPAGGTARSLPAVDHQAILRTYSDAFRPENSSLVLVGGMDRVTAERIAGRFFGDWKVNPNGEIDAYLPSSPPAAIARRAYLLDIPNASQSGIAVSLPGLKRADAKFYALTVANAVLGNGLSSRLNRELRIKRGLSYWAGSTMRSWRSSGIVTAQTQTSTRSTVDAAMLLLAELRRLTTEPPTDAEVEARRALVAGIYGMRVETTAGLASAIRDNVLQDIDPGEAAAYSDTVLSVRSDAVRSVLPLFVPERLIVVIAGRADELRGPLQKAFPGLQVIAPDRLDLESPGLTIK